MSKAKKIENTNTTLQASTVQIMFQCPVCAKSARLHLEKDLFERSDHLVTISIPKDIICDHCFHAFVDKNYQVRGYQRVDFEVNKSKDQQSSSDLHQLQTESNDKSRIERAPKDDVDFKKLILNKNELIYNPETFHRNGGEEEHKLKSIYEEFWEFISNDNELFEKYIRKDKRRIHFLS